MTFFAFSTPTSAVEVPDYKTLQSLWRRWKDSDAHLFIGRVTVTKPLTDAQLRRLHSDLRKKIAA